MATQAVPHHSEASAAGSQDVFAFFVSSLNDVLEQLANGVQTPKVTFTDISALGGDGVQIWEDHIQ